MQVHMTLKSSNAKVGPIPVSTTTKASCPTACPLSAKGCYANGGPLAIHWTAVTAGTRGTDWKAFCDTVAGLPEGQLWRHNQAGDLPGVGNTIDGQLLGQLVEASRHARGFTYTHKPVLGEDAVSLANADHVAAANIAGFTINLSANNTAQADQLLDLNAGPVVTLMPLDGWQEGGKTAATPAGHLVVRCPAEYRDGVSCATCQLCAQADRSFVVGFTAHGASRKAADVIARG